MNGAYEIRTVPNGDGYRLEVWEKKNGKQVFASLNTYTRENARKTARLMGFYLFAYRR